MNYKYTRFELSFLLICLAISLYFVFSIFQSFLGPFIFATIFSATLLPIHKKIIQYKYISNKISAILLILGLTFLLIGPLSFIVTNSIEEFLSLTSSTNSAITQTMAPNNKISKTSQVIEKISDSVSKYTGHTIPVDMLKKQWEKVLQSLKDDALSYVNNTLNNITQFLFNYIVFCLTIYIILTRGAGLKRVFHKLSLLPEKDEEIILRKIENLNRVLLIGNTLGGILQSLVIFTLLSFTHIEKIFFWSLLTLICSFIPVFGSSLIFLPISIYLWFTGENAMAIVTISISGVFFLFVENWFKPKFIGGRIHMHSLIILFSMLGGVKLFGIAGIFYGPLVTTIFFTLFEVFHEQQAQN